MSRSRKGLALSYHSENSTDLFSSSLFLLSFSSVLNLLNIDWKEVFLTNVGKLSLDFSHWRWLCTFYQTFNLLHALSNKNVDHQYLRSCSASMKRNVVYT